MVLQNLIRSTRNAAYTGLRAFGGFHWISSSKWRQQRLLIICYHGVSLQDEHEWDPELFVTREFLLRRFNMLRNEGYVVLSLGDAARLLMQGNLPPRSVVLTFDDGFYNFYTTAAPLLEQFGYPATVYLSTYFVIHQRPIVGLTLRYLLWRARHKILEPNLLPGQVDTVDLRIKTKRERLAANLLEKAKSFSSDREKQQAWLAHLAEQLDIDWDEFLHSRLFHLMTESEVKEIAHRGFDVQLHTHRHRSPREKSSFYAEIFENRSIIEQLTGRPAVHFCYPSGDVDSCFLPWLRDLDVETATTCSVALAHPSQDALLMPRFVDTLLQPEIVFESWLCGAGSFLNNTGAR